MKEQIGKKASYNGATFTVHSILSKTGKLKNGKEAPYVQLQRDDNSDTVIELHPRKAHTLFTKGEAEGIRMLVDAVAAEPASAEPAAASEKKVSKKSQCLALYNAGCDAGKTRPEILADFATVGVTGPGAATYYQNCKSGLWI